jgi:hypothetical protein
MLKKVISGFQTGVDIAGIRAAKAAGLETGGYIPKAFKTLDGPKPEYAHHYGAVEHSSNSYKERTWDNVYSSDGTIRIARSFTSPGEVCTKNAIVHWGKPSFDFNANNELISNPHEVIIQWLKIHNIEVLNVAGNSEQTAPGIYQFAYDLLLKVFKEIKNGHESLSERGVC